MRPVAPATATRFGGLMMAVAVSKEEEGVADNSRVLLLLVVVRGAV